MYNIFKYILICIYLNNITLDNQPGLTILTSANLELIIVSFTVTCK